MKQVIVVRKDLKMGCGKIAGQVAHASLRAFWEAEKESTGKALEWAIKHNETKIVLKVNSKEELTKIINKTIKMGLPHGLVYDAGRTQLEPNTLTAIGIGPSHNKLIDQVVGDLKLL